jgi:thioredoxin 2
MLQSMSYTYVPCNSCLKLNRVHLGRAEVEQPICGACKMQLPVEHGVVTVSGTSLQHLIDHSPIPVIVDFSAPWCVPCQAFEPEFQRAAQAMGEKLVFAKLDTKEFAIASSTYEIRSVPTLILFRNGREVERKFGAISSEQLIRWLSDTSVSQAA